MFKAEKTKDDSLTVSKAAIFLLTVCGLVLAGGVGAVRAQAITEDFANITTLPAAGWVTQNNSTPVGTTGWFQGNSSFSAQAGAATSYIAANFNNTTGDNTISNWLLTPNRNFTNGDVIKFWSKSTQSFPDRLEVRLSTNGASANVGAGSTAVGDFTTLLLTINPTLTASGYPSVWTEYTITLSGLPATGASGRAAFRYFVTNGGPSGANSIFIGIDTFSYTPAGPSVAQRAKLDYNGDNKTDFTVVRNTGGGSTGQITWFINQGASSTSTQWGTAADKFIAGDYDGDQKTDITVWRASESGDSAHSYFYILQSNGNTFRSEQLGSQGDDPTVVGDYDGDGKADVAVYRAGANAGMQSYWFYRPSGTPGVNFRSFPWGINGDFPAPGDYDGDGKADYAVQRNNGGGNAAFFINKSGGTANETVIFGSPTDVICPGDYDADGKTDFMVIRGVGGAIRWHLLTRAGVISTLDFGLSASDFPVHGDYDGDGKVDIAVWRPAAGEFYVKRSSDGAFQSFKWGQNGDYPVANFNTH